MSHPHESLTRLSAPGAHTRLRRRGAFTLIELLVVVGVIAVLAAMLLPSLSAAQAQGRTVKCASNQRQLATALAMYAADHRGWAMPAQLDEPEFVTYWWGAALDGRVDHEAGLTWPYLQGELREAGVYECPEQPVGTYDDFQAVDGELTSTYGYNAYFLTPSRAPGWREQIGHRPWQNLDTMPATARVFAFADSMLVLSGNLRNSALLDPPALYRGPHRWGLNPSPTTSFRHRGQTVAAHVDGHVAAKGPEGGRMEQPEYGIGSVGATNDPHYVPDWRDW